MRTRILLFCGIILALCLWLLLHHASEQKNDTASETQATLTKQPSAQSAQPKTSEKYQNTNTQMTSNGSPTKSPVWPTAEAFSQQALSAWQAPIEFYGKVVDENTNPIEGVSVLFQWDESATEDVARTSMTKSDVDGLFELQGQHGRSLEVSVSKDGYYNSKKDRTGYLYALTSERFLPSRLNPVLFHLRKKEKGEPLIHIGGIGLHTMRDYLLSSDGKPTDVSLLTGHLAPESQADLQVTFHAGPPLEGFSSRITWQCQVTVPGGGLVQTDEEFPFLAPQNDYSNSDEWSITETNWTEEIQRQYYVKLRNGDFGRVTIRVLGVSNPFFRMESYVNPSGSQDLEPAQ